MMSHSSCYATLRRPFVLAFTAWALLLSFHAHAITTNWNNSNGTFTNAANWDNSVPDSDDTAVVPTADSSPTPSPSPARRSIRRRIMSSTICGVRTNEVTFVDAQLAVHKAAQRHQSPAPVIQSLSARMEAMSPF